MIYVLYLAIVGTILALGGGLWYTLRRSAATEDANTALVENTRVQGDKIKTLDQRIVDDEYARRVEEKKKNEEIVKSGDSAAAGGLLKHSTEDRDTN